MFSRNQLTVFIGMYLGYILVVINRKSFTYLVPSIINNENLDTATVGLTLSSVAFGYSIGKFAFGLLIDKANPRFMLAGGLFMSGFFNIIFSISHPKWFSFLYFFVGISQGPAWPACIKIMKRWYPVDALGTIWSVVSTSINVAASFGPVSYSLLVERNQGAWRPTMMIGGIAACIMATLLLALIKENPAPSTLIMREIELVSHTNSDDINMDNVVSNAAHQPASLRSVFFSPYMYVICFAHLSSQMMKEMLSDWEPLYLMQEKHASQLFVSSFTASLESGGFIGSILSGYFSDILLSKFGTNSKRKGHPRHFLLIPLYTLLLVFLYVLRTCFTDVSHHQSSVICLAFLIGFSLYSVVSLVGVLVIDNADENISGTAHAISALVGNLGSVISGLPFSMLVKSLSWSGAFRVYEMVIGFSILSFLLSETISCRIGQHAKRE